MGIEWKTIKDRHGAATASVEVRALACGRCSTAQRQKLARADRAYVDESVTRIFFVYPHEEVEIAEVLGTDQKLPAIDEVPTRPGFDVKSPDVYRDFRRARLTIYPEFVETPVQHSNYVCVAVEIESYDPDGDENGPFAGYDADLTGAMPIELRFGGERVTAEHALAMARAGIHAMLSPTFVRAFEEAVRKPCEEVRFDLEVMP